MEEQNVIVPFLDKATKGSKVRTSGVYDEALRVLDTMVPARLSRS